MTERRAGPSKQVVLQARQPIKSPFEGTAQQFAKGAAEVHAATVRFVNTEAETGLTLARLAADSRDAKKKARNRCNARKAYDTALKRVGAVAQSEDLEAVHQKLRKLRKLLKSLGEELQ